MKTRNILNLVFTLCAVILVTGMAYGQNITYNSPWHYINSPHGYIRMGPANSSGAHIYTNKARFFFDKPIWSITGEFSAYSNNNLKLQTAGITRITALKSNGNVGIGTTAPGYKLQVVGDMYASNGLSLRADNGNQLRLIRGNYGFIHRNDGTNYYMLTTASGDQNGSWSSKRPFRINIPTGDVFLGNNNLNVVGNNVGIQNTNPKGHLQVNDRLVINSPGAGYWGWIGNNVYWDSNTSAENNPKRVVSGHAAEYGFTNTGDLLLRTAASGTANTKVNYKLNMIVKNNGGIGINTWDVPEGYELAVNGAILAEEVRVRPSSYWPDYVFGSKYKLMSIDEVAQYITENGHLPNMPKAEVVEAEGYHVGEMDVKLLEKIEELTLYAIDADEKIEEQQQQINELAQLLNELKQQIDK